MRKLEIIKYHNDLKTLNINHLKLQELKIFIKLIQCVQDKQEEILNISFNEFRETINNNITDKELTENINNAVKKAISSYITITNKDKTLITHFTFFNKFQIDIKNKVVIAQVNKEFLYLINELIKNYATLILSDTIQFKSKYSLLLYKKIREYYKQEKLILNFKTFKQYLNVEDKPIRYINDKIIKQIKTELPKIFKDFKIEKVKEWKTIKNIVFSWKYESNKDKLNIKNNEDSGNDTMRKSNKESDKNSWVIDNL